MSMISRLMKASNVKAINLRATKRSKTDGETISFDLENAERFDADYLGALLVKNAKEDNGVVLTDVRKAIGETRLRNPEELAFDAEALAAEAFGYVKSKSKSKSKSKKKGNAVPSDSVVNGATV